MTSIKESDKISVLLVDGQRILREGLRLILDSNPSFTTVGECGILASASQLVEQTSPDVTLFGLQYEDGNGVDRIPSLAERTRVVVLTGDPNPLVHEQCLKSGASGLISKDAASQELFDVIKTVASGEIWFDKGLMTKVVRDLTQPHATTDVELRRIETLSPREREVITLVGEGLKNRVIADRLFISETTVRHHMTSILGKLELSSRLELVVFAFRHGLAAIPDRARR